ncbi:hypothetical protein V7122_25640 [Bacillus sp. JJ1532]|uniref:hypothetical protein n=1 Tax=Bacillus sp. JJ1532 TaxID=3122958 RepID=UPI002FFE879C
MEQHIKDGLVEWLSSLKEQRETLKSLNIDAELKIDVLKAKYNIALSASESVGFRKKDDYFNKYVKDIEEQLDTSKKLFEIQKVENREKIQELSVLISKIEERL